MAHLAFTPENADATSTPTSDAPSVATPVTPHDIHSGYSPGAIYSRSAGQPSPSVHSIHSLQTSEANNGKRRLGLLEYPTRYEDLQFCRDMRERFRAYLLTSTNPLETEQVAIDSFESLKTSFEDMCQIPPPECVFYQWSYKQSHSADASSTGADVFHILNENCYMFDFDPQETSSDFPVPDASRVVTVLNLTGCQKTSLMLAFGLRRFLRKSITEGREIFWMIYNTLADLATCVLAEFLKAQPFLDRNVQLMSTIRAQRGATGALAYSGVFPTRAEVSYAMRTYAAEVREAAEKAGAGLQPVAPEASPLSFAMHRLDRLFQGIENTAEDTATGQFQDLEQPAMLLPEQFVGEGEQVYSAPTQPSNEPLHPPQQSSEAHDAQTRSSKPPMMTARFKRTPPTTCPPFTPVEVTFRPCSPYPLSDTPSPVDGTLAPSGSSLAEATVADESHATSSKIMIIPPQSGSRPARNSSELTLPTSSTGPSAVSNGNVNEGATKQSARRQPPLSSGISCSDVTKLLRDENMLHEKFIDFATRFHDNVSDYGASTLEKLVRQHRDLVDQRQEQKRQREMAARKRTSRASLYFYHGPTTSRLSPLETAAESNARRTAEGVSGSSITRSRYDRDNEPAYMYLPPPEMLNDPEYTGRNFGNVFNAPPAPDPIALHIHNQHDRQLQRARQTCMPEVVPTNLPPSPPPYAPEIQRLQPGFGPPLSDNLALPSLDQTELVAPRPLRPTLPPLTSLPSGSAWSPLAESRSLNRPQNEGYGALLEALHSIPPVPLAEQNEMDRQQYERYYQQQQYQLELQRQNQEQDRLMQTYQEQTLQHQRQILAQQAMIQRDQMAHLDYMKYQHQVHLLRRLHTLVLQQVEAQRKAAREAAASTPSNDDEDEVEDGVAETPNSHLDDRSDTSSDEEDGDVPDDNEYPGPPIRRGWDERHFLDLPPIIDRTTPPDVSTIGTRPTRYTVSRNRPQFGAVSGIAATAPPSSSPFRRAMVNAMSGAEDVGHDGQGGGSGGRNESEDDALYM